MGGNRYQFESSLTIWDVDNHVESLRGELQQALGENAELRDLLNQQATDIQQINHGWQLQLGSALEQQARIAAALAEIANSLPELAALTTQMRAESDALVAAQQEVRAELAALEARKDEGAVRKFYPEFHRQEDDTETEEVEDVPDEDAPAEEQESPSDVVESAEITESRDAKWSSMRISWLGLNPDIRRKLEQAHINTYGDLEVCTATSIVERAHLDDEELEYLRGKMSYEKIVFRGPRPTAAASSAAVAEVDDEDLKRLLEDDTQRPRQEESREPIDDAEPEVDDEVAEEKSDADDVGAATQNFLHWLGNLDKPGR